MVESSIVPNSPRIKALRLKITLLPETQKSKRFIQRILFRATGDEYCTIGKFMENPHLIFTVDENKKPFIGHKKEKGKIKIDLTETDKVTGFELGGVDYLTKPFQYQEAAVRLAAHVRISRLQKRLQENNESLQQEIEQRHHAEAALRENEERFRTLFENAPVMIYAYDSEDGYTLWNSECERRLGYTKEDMMSHPDPLSLFFLVCLICFVHDLLHPLKALQHHHKN